MLDRNESACKGKPLGAIVSSTLAFGKRPLSLRHANLRRVLLSVIPLLALLVTFRQALAQPQVLETGWSLVETITVPQPASAVHSPFDGRTYLLRRERDPVHGGEGGLYVADGNGTLDKIADFDRPVGLLILDATTAFVSEDYAGIIYRVTLPSGIKQEWVTGFGDQADDDPTGMAQAPPEYSGGVLTPGEAVVVDEGVSNGADDEVWAWSTSVSGSARVLHSDDSGNSPLVAAVDIAVDTAGVFLVDTRGNSPGRIYEVLADGTVSRFSTSVVIEDPIGITIDPVNGDLIVLDSDAGRVLRVDRASGFVSVILCGVVAGYSRAGIEISTDGSRLVLTERGSGRVLTYERSLASEVGPAVNALDKTEHDDLAASRELQNVESCNPTDVGEAPISHDAPGRASLYQNSPNPFNPMTTIRFDLARDAHVELRIYDVAGRLIRTLVNQQMGQASHKVVWNGRDDEDRPVSSGVYVYRLETADFTATRKMVVAR